MAELLTELRRRNVFRIAALYLVFAWLILQVADVAFGVLRMPDWSLTLVATILALGFLPACVFAWIYEVTPEGIRKDAEVDHDSAAALAASRRVNLAILGVLVIAVGIFGARTFLSSGSVEPPVDEGKAATRSDADQTFADAPAAGPDDEAPTAAVPATDRSIAVLPFVNMSAVAENEYFSDGLTETLLHKLSQLKGLRVAARTSSFAFKGSGTDVREIGEKLNVRHVLEGSVQRAGDRVRITAQLIQADDGFHLWSATYDRNLDDIFAVQDEIADQVAGALELSLIGAGSSDGGTEDTVAYDLYLQARAAWRDGTEERYAEAARLVRQALDRDPDFALAWSTLALVVIDGASARGQRRIDMADEAIATATRGVELAPGLSDTHAALGRVYERLTRDRQARPALERAVELDPDNAEALSWLARVQFGDGEYRRARRTADRAMALDPLEIHLKADATPMYLQVGDYEGAEALAREVLHAEPDSVRGLSALGNVYWRTGRHAQAFRTYHRLLAINPNTAYIQERIARSFQDLGDFENARRWFERAAEINPLAIDSDLAQLAIYEGDRDRARAILLEALAKEPDAEWRADMAAELAILDADFEAALGHLERRMELARERGARFSLVLARLEAALIADRADLAERRDAYLAPVREELRIDLEEHGADGQYVWWMAATVAALDGDAARCATNLDRAISRGLRDLPFLLQSGFYDKVLGDPEVVAVVDRLRAINREEREKLEAAVAELEGAFGP